MSNQGGLGGQGTYVISANPHGGQTVAHGGQLTISNQVAVSPPLGPGALYDECVERVRGATFTLRTYEEIVSQKRAELREAEKKEAEAWQVLVDARDLRCVKEVLES